MSAASLPKSAGSPALGVVGTERRARREKIVLAQPTRIGGRKTLAWMVLFTRICALARSPRGASVMPCTPLDAV